VLDQAVRGLGYPVVLAEAHEKAVVSGGDRESFWLLVESAIEQRRLPHRITEKSQSKHIRGI
jgi:NurA-like 5'-3' nuclease